MTVLQKTIQKSGSYPTQFSLLMDPENEEIYLARKGDFSKIWKVSIKNKTIETYRGFSEHTKTKIGKDGIYAKELDNIKNDYGLSRMFFVIFGFLVIVFLLLAFTIIMKLKKRKNITI